MYSISSMSVVGRKLTRVLHGILHRAMPYCGLLAQNPGRQHRQHRIHVHRVTWERDRRPFEGRGDSKDWEVEKKGGGEGRFSAEGTLSWLELRSYNQGSQWNTGEMMSKRAGKGPRWQLIGRQ